MGSIATGVLTTSTFENCLFLNVYTPPRAAGRLLPVMVLIHGGGGTALGADSLGKPAGASLAGQGRRARA